MAAGVFAASVRFIPACAGNSSARGCRRRGPTVHPRVCGELTMAARCRGGAIGSSPRVRGTPSLRLRAVRPLRFIPACAGNSPLTIASTASRYGSSPRVRGTPRRSCTASAPQRFIPACAGNSRCCRLERTRAAVHPRVCGELRTVSVALDDGTGSSPRVRGTRVPPDQRDVDGRFIPACAGNSRKRLRQAAPEGGSSPRVRGTRAPASPPGKGGRFIPACAGNSSVWAVSPRLMTVHPRVCGELGGGSGRGAVHRGSSPRVRGTPHPGGCAARRRRFIPACAGNSYWSSSIESLVTGSSPRVRGTQRRHHGGSARLRFIPACAGNSAVLAADPVGRAVHPRVCGELPERR